jgi:hypothetical protein
MLPTWIPLQDYESVLCRAGSSFGKKLGRLSLFTFLSLNSGASKIYKLMIMLLRDPVIHTVPYNRPTDFTYIRIVTYTTTFSAFWLCANYNKFVLKLLSILLFWAFIYAALRTPNLTTSWISYSHNTIEILIRRYRDIKCCSSWNEKL